MIFFKKQHNAFLYSALILLSTAGFFALGRSLRALQPLKELFHAGEYARKTLIRDNKIKKVLFSPDNPVKKTLLGLIQEEQESIRIAAFSLTDIDIAAALIKAHEQGILVEIVVDGQQSRSTYSKVPVLFKRGIPIFSYEPLAGSKETKEWTSLMHNKFIIFGKSLLNKAVLWTGSFNFTRTASLHNQENVIIDDDQEVSCAYMNHFEVLKRRCHRVSSPSAYA
ncbi:MAG: phospholipase D-like domain-containing protein [Candidatus Babeliaceae bacterium]|jgi:phosphatidylserine/phosphatidylglycerophosphate/cardiolipin synthase-like enzyme